MAIPVKLEIFMEDLTKSGLQSVGKNIDDVENQTLQLISALRKVRAEQQKIMQDNIHSGKNYSQDLARIQALTGRINRLEVGLIEYKRVQQDISNNPGYIDIDTEAVTRKTNNLKMQFSQVARELPSLAMGPQMFILAISNNLPMLADAIADVRKQNELLAASGQKGVPVWKQLASSIFSWQTALVAAISLGIVFGKDIANWVKELISGKKAIDNNKEALENYKKAMLDSQQAAQEEIVQLNLLYQAAVDSSKGMNERISAVKELKKEFPQYFKNLSDEEVLVGKAADKYNELATAIMASAKAQAAKETLIKNSKEILDLETKITEEYKKQELNEIKRTEAVGKLKEGQKRTFLPVSNDVIDAANRNYDRKFKESEEKITEWRRKIYDLTKFNKNLANQVNIEDLLFESNGGNETERKQKTDYASQLADARVKAQQTTEKLRLQIMMEGIAKRKALAKQEYDDGIADIDKQERDTLAKMDKARKQGDNIPQSQYDSVKQEAQTQRILAEQVYQKELAEIDQEYYDKATQSLIDYYAEYGTYQEKRLAIAQDYARKIAAAETDGEVMSLEKQRDNKIQELDFSEFKESMDWEKIFGDLDRVSTDTLEKLRENLKEYLSGIGDDISPESFAEVMDAFQDIDSQLADRSPFESLKSGYKEYEEAMREVIQAQNLLQQAEKSGLVIVEEYDENTGELTRELITQAEAEERLRNAQDKRYNAQKTLTQAVNSIGQKGEAVVNAGNDIVDMLTSLGVKVPEALQGVLGGVGTITSSLASINFMQPFSILTGITGTLKGIGQTIGGILGFGGADYSGYEEMKTQYEGLIDIWDTLIDKKTEYIDIDYGIEAKKAAEEAIKLTETQIERQRQLANMLAGSGASVGSHSLGYRVNDRMSSQDWQNLSDLVGQQINSLDDVLKLDADVIGKVLQDEHFVNVLTTVNSDFIEYIQNIEAYGEQLEEIAEKEKEAITGIGFDSFKDEYIDLLSDLESTNEDFADNLEKNLQNAFFRSLIANKYNSQIKALYDNWVKLGEDGLTTDEVESLRQQNQAMIDQMIKDREELMNTFGWQTESSSTDSSQSPSSGVLTTMSQDSISTFEGIGRNMQTHLANVDRFVQELKETQKMDSETLATIASHTAYIVMIYELMEDMKINGIKTQ